MTPPASHSGGRQPTAKREHGGAVDFDRERFRHIPMDLTLEQVVDYTGPCWVREALSPAHDPFLDLADLEALTVRCRNAGILTLGDAVSNAGHVVGDVLGIRPDPGLVSTDGAVGPGTASGPFAASRNVDSAHRDRNLLLAGLMTACANVAADPSPIAEVWPRLGPRTSSPRRACTNDEILTMRVMRWWELHHGDDRALKPALAHVLLDAGVLAGEMYDVWINHLKDEPTDPTHLDSPGLTGLQRPTADPGYFAPPPYVDNRILTLDAFHQLCLRTGVPRRIATVGRHARLATDGSPDLRDDEEVQRSGQKRVARPQGNVGKQFDRLIIKLGLSPEMSPYSVHRWRATTVVQDQDLPSAAELVGRSPQRARRLLRLGDRPRVAPAATTLLPSSGDTSQPGS